jgi:hypothetical protein
MLNNPATAHITTHKMIEPTELLLGISIGYIVTKLLAGKKEREQGILKSLKIPIKNKTIHLHHWLIALTALIILAIIQYNNTLIDGLLIGIILQGITYKDFLKIIY